MGDKNGNPLFQKVLYILKQGNTDQLKTWVLRDWLNAVDTSEERIQFFARKVEFELQRREMLETIKWQKWMTIMTGFLALATFILAIITYFKS